MSAEKFEKIQLLGSSISIKRVDLTPILHILTAFEYELHLAEVKHRDSKKSLTNWTIRRTGLYECDARMANIRDSGNSNRA